MENSLDNNIICEQCEEHYASIQHEGEYLCIACKQDEDRYAYTVKRNDELSQWVEEQGDLSLEEIMIKAYSEFVHFDDFGRVLHYYMEQKNNKV